MATTCRVTYNVMAVLWSTAILTTLTQLISSIRHIFQGRSPWFFTAPISRDAYPSKCKRALPRALHGASTNTVAGSRLRVTGSLARLQVYVPRTEAEVLFGLQYMRVRHEGGHFAPPDNFT